MPTTLNMIAAVDGAIEHEGYEPAVVGTQVDEHQEGSDGRSGSDGHQDALERGPHGALLGHEAHHHHGDEGEADRPVAEGREGLAPGEGDRQRHYRRDHGGQGRQDAHRSDGEAGVQQRDGDGAGDAGEGAPETRHPTTRRRRGTAAGSPAARVR